MEVYLVIGESMLSDNNESIYVGTDFDKAVLKYKAAKKAFIYRKIEVWVDGERVRDMEIED